MTRGKWHLVFLISLTWGSLSQAIADELGSLVSLELVGASDSQNDQPFKLIGRSDRLQLVVTARFDSGATRDWTGQTSYQTAPANIVQVDASGYVVPQNEGEVTVTASAAGKQASVKIAVERLNDPPPVHFANHVVPIFTKLGCNGGGCHGKSGGQNGFALSLLGFEPQEDYTHIVMEGRGRRVSPGSPEHSLLLRKASGQLPHGGGPRMPPGSDDYRILLQWIEQGMPQGSEEDPVLESISVFPEIRTLSRHGRQQLRVSAHYSDGSARDITRQCQYEPNDREFAEIENGLVQTTGKTGDVAVMVRFQGEVTAFRATVPLGAPVEKLPPERNFIDKLVFAKLKQLGMPPSEVCDDSTFLRRVTLDICGRLPRYEETQAFLADQSADKRARLVDRLLASDAYADYFAQKWAAILRNKVVQNQPRDGNFRFHDWVRTSLLNNKPYDAFVRELVTASGDASFNPAVNWHRQLDDVNERVEDTAQVFLGLRIQCARCHHHPFEKWSQQDYWGLAAFYANVRLKENRYVYVQRGVSQTRHPRTNEGIFPTALDGEPLELSADDDARQNLARWLTARENPYFARALANRYWKHFFGRGIVDPEDDMRATNPPSNPELLEALARHFLDSNFDMKQLVRTICNSSTYQLSSFPNEFNAQDQQAFSRFQPRRLPAEVMLDGLDQLLGSGSNFNGLPQGTKAVEIPDHGGVNDSFLNAFGRPAGASACECERSGDISMTQSLQMLNSNDLYNKLDQSRARKLADDKERTHEEKITELHLRAFCRQPTETEMQIYLQHLAGHEENQQYQAYEDILWTLSNTKEFMFNH